jgi:hypothetical protein
MKVFIAICFCLLINANLNCQVWKWAKTAFPNFVATGDNMDKLVVDSLNNFYASANGVSAAIVAKFDQDGNEIWKRTFTGRPTIAGIFYHLHSIYISGWFADSITTGTITYFSQKPVAFLMRLDNLGNVMWHRIINGTDRVYGGGLVIAGNKILMVGDFTDTLILGSHVYSSACGNKMFIVTYDLNGNQLFAKTTECVGEYGLSMGVRIAVNNANEIYCYGKYFNYFKMDSSTVSGPLSIYNNEYLLKINQFSDIAWAITLPANDVYSNVNDIVFDTQGNILLAGAASYHSSLPHNFLLKINKNGQLIFNKAISLGVGCGIEQSSSNSCYIIGEQFLGHYGKSRQKLMLMKLDTIGNEIWRDTIASEYVNALSIRRDYQSDYIVSGVMEKSLVFGFEKITAQGINSFFIAKFSDGPPSTGLGDNFSNNTIEIFPNPAEDKLFLKIGTGKIGIRITDVYGNIIYKEQINSVIDLFEIDFKNVSNGVYFVSVARGPQIINRKVVKN